MWSYSPSARADLHIVHNDKVSFSYVPSCVQFSYILINSDPEGSNFKSSRTDLRISWYSSLKMSAGVYSCRLIV